MTRNELTSIVSDTLAINSLSAAQSVSRVLERGNGVGATEALAAALTVARDQACEIAELKRELAEQRDVESALREDIEALEADGCRLENDLERLIHPDGGHR